MTELTEVTINRRWKLKVPAHRVATWENNWEPERIESMWRNIQKNDVVYDVGAEQFDMSGLIASWGAKMVLVEPSPWGWPTGKAIWEGNNLPDPLFTLEGFAAKSFNEHGRKLVELDNWPTWPDAAGGDMNVKEGFSVLNQRPDMPAIPLDGLFGAVLIPKPDVITMDVEGAEFEVLKGAELLLEVYKPMLFISEHPEFMFANFNQYQADMHSFLHAKGYQYKFLAMDHEQHFLWYHPEGRQPK